MTRVERLENLFKLVELNKTKSLLKIWYEIFEVTTIYEVYARLESVQNEIDELEKEIKELKLYNNPHFQTIISSLNTIIQFPSLNSTINNQSFMQDPQKNSILQTFDMLKTFIDNKHIQVESEEDIPNSEFEKFKINIQKIILEIENSNISDDDKKIFLSIFHDINKGLSLYKINGLNALIEVLRNNICKLQILENHKSQKYTQLAKKYFATIWSWSKKYMKKKVQNILESETTKLLENMDKHISEWNNDNDNDDLDDSTSKGK